MKISTKGEYGIRALMELTVRHGQGYVQSTDIAAARNIPANYLYQLLITLRKAGIIRSRRGPQGGHMLARAPEDINLADAVVALEGPLAPLPCVQHDLVDDCPFGDDCALRDVWRDVANATRRILEDANFADLVQSERERSAAH